MVNQSNIRNFAEYLRKKGIAPCVTLLGRNESQNLSFEWEGFYGTDQKNFVNKIGYVMPIAKGGFSGQIWASGGEGLAERYFYASGATEEIVIKKLRKDLEGRQNLIKSLEDPATALDFELKHFDVYYSYSDDHSVWSAGNAAQKRIQILCDKLGKDFTTELKRVRPEIKD